jgi:hypothetical protein
MKVIIGFAILLGVYLYRVYKAWSSWCVNAKPPFRFPSLWGKISTNIVKPPKGSSLPKVTVNGSLVTCAYDGEKDRIIPAEDFLPLLFAHEYTYPKWVNEVETAVLTQNSIFVLRNSAKEYVDKVPAKYRLAFINRLKREGIEDWVCTEAGIFAHLGDARGSASEKIFYDLWKQCSRH